MPRPSFDLGVLIVLVQRTPGIREDPPDLEMSVAMSLLELTLETVEANLALDEALLIEADEGRAGAVLRFWDFPRFAVVLGASRRLAGDVRVDACQEDGVPIVRRSSGGGTVVIGPGALNVTVILPNSAAPGLSAVDIAHRYVLDRIAGALRAFDRAVAVEGSGDLTVSGRKFGGSAQRRLRSWFLVHCTILHAFSLERIGRYLAVPSRQPAYRAGRGHEDFLMNLDLPRTTLHGSICSAWSPSSSLSPATDVPHDLLEALLSERFANRSWIERL